MFSATPAPQNAEPSTGAENANTQPSEANAARPKPDFHNFYNYLGTVDPRVAEGTIPRDAKVMISTPTNPDTAEIEALNILSLTDIDAEIRTDFIKAQSQPLKGLAQPECIECETDVLELAINDLLVEKKTAEVILDRTKLSKADLEIINEPQTGSLTEMAANLLRTAEESSEIKADAEITAPLSPIALNELSTLEKGFGNTGLEQEGGAKGLLAQYFTESTGQQGLANTTTNTAGALIAPLTNGAILTKNNIAPNNDLGDTSSQSAPLLPLDEIDIDAQNDFVATNETADKASSNDAEFLTTNKAQTSATTASAPVSPETITTSSILAATETSLTSNATDKTVKPALSNAISEQVANAIKSSTLASKISAQIAGQTSGTSDIIVRLDPADLGRVNISFTFESANSVTAQIVTDNAATLSVLRERSELLTAQLRQNGFENVTLNFDSANSGSGFEQNQDSNFAEEFGQDDRTSQQQRSTIFEANQEDDLKEEIPAKLQTLSANDTVDIKL